jgi:hypothetical protein
MGDDVALGTCSDSAPLESKKQKLMTKTALVTGATSGIIKQQRKY